MMPARSKEFINAWKKGVELYPDFFLIEGIIEKATTLDQLKPMPHKEWHTLLSFRSNGEKAFLSCMASFYRRSYWNDHYLREYDYIVCTGIAVLSASLDHEHREILANLFLYY